MSIIPAWRTVVATFAALAFVATSSPAGAEEKRQPPAQGKSVVKKGPAVAPKARDGKGRTETVDNNETITIHRK